MLGSPSSANASKKRPYSSLHICKHAIELGCPAGVFVFEVGGGVVLGVCGKGHAWAMAEVTAWLAMLSRQVV